MMIVMEINAKTFGQNLENARVRAGMTQPDLLKRLEALGFTLSQPALSHYEKGRRFPDPPMMAAMAQILEVSLDHLMGLTEITSPVTELLEDLANASGEGKINKIIKQLPKDKQEQVITFAEYLLAQEQKSKSNHELEEWITATEVLMRRYGATGENSFMALLAAERPDLAAALGFSSKKKSVQDR
jgi:transcriptional regulator with XRE-family HTH domain